MSLGATELFFSAQALLIIRSSVSWLSNTGFGSLVKISMVWASTLTTLSMPLVKTVKFEVLLIARWSENTASSAVKFEPSWNLTPVRKVMRIWVGVTCFQLVARTGSGLKVFEL